jgi:hypothetical protein
LKPYSITDTSEILGGCPRIAIIARVKLAELDFSII